MRGDTLGTYFLRPALGARWEVGADGRSFVADNHPGTEPEEEMALNDGENEAVMMSLQRRTRLLLARFGITKHIGIGARGSSGGVTNTPLYFCAQALFKFHPAFIAALANILLGDPKGHLLLIRPAATTSSSRSWAEMVSMHLKMALLRRVAVGREATAVEEAAAEHAMSRVHWTARLGRQVRLASHRSPAPSPCCLARMRNCADTFSSPSLPPACPTTASNARANFQSLARAHASQELLSMLKVADVVLDTFPFGGGVTSLQAFAMGTPLVALPSKFLRGRLTLALFRQMGCIGKVAMGGGALLPAAAWTRRAAAATACASASRAASRSMSSARWRWDATRRSAPLLRRRSAPLRHGSSRMTRQCVSGSTSSARACVRAVRMRTSVGST